MSRMTEGLAILTLAAVLGAASLAFVAAGAGRAWAQEEDEEEDVLPDSLAADSLAAADSAEAGSGERAPRPVKSQTGFHPSYDVRYGIEKDVRTWNHGVNADYMVGEKLRLKNQTGLRAKDEQTLKRTVETRTTSTSLEYLLSEAVTMGVRYSTNWNLDDNRSRALAVETKTTNSDVGVFSRFEKAVAENMIFNASTSAGTRNNEYSQFTEEGTQADMELGVDYTPVKSVRTDFSWSGNRATSTTMTIGAADSPEEAPIEAENRDVAQQIRANISYNPSSNFNFRIGAFDANGQYQYPHADSAQYTETRTEDRSNASFGTKFRASERLSLGIEASRSNTEKDYDLEAGASDALRTPLVRRGNRQTKEDARATVSYKGWTGGTTNLALDRDRAYEQFPNQQAQEKSIAHGAVTLNHDQKISAKLSTDVSLKIDLISYIFFRADEPRRVPTSDRDLLAQSLEWKGNYVVSDKLTTNFALGVKEDRTVNIAAAQSGENNTKQAWWLRPSFSVKPLAGSTLRQVYEVRNDYTFAEDAKGQNLLTRKTQVDTKFTYQVTSVVDFDLSHFFQVRDAGSYDRVRETFRRATQFSKQSLDLSTGYAPMRGVRLAVGQRIELNRNYDFKDVDGTIRRVKQTGPRGESERVEFFIEGSMRRDVTKRLKVEARARRTLADGTSVSERERRFYRVEASAGYAL
ncbi:MAG: hypothetical protein ACKVU1_12885 [bacterium]